ncbi:DNA-binding transcriptional regulator YdaS (Cro superfamily) [Sphingomonas sp. SORGH_AS802]|uniref:hypothetical protein n=1 Tax=Sphingomonas sp. SORGH_AS_0802 TaxID=3041800 RepID=UPI0028671AF2|nr:hypothetical protein [Sphingomonas sp. SORGH_AS_0802]MDR6135733.1 DNA-binding transcriptional regulator YdaS (Cro superfamily) [Sphingomonas sp. SORGH_AS_0802]
MAIEHEIDTPFAQAVRAIGSQSATARIIGKSQTAVFNKLKAQGLVWDTAVLKLEAVTGIPKHILRPDLFEAPPEPTPFSYGTTSPTLAPTRPAVPCDQAAASHPRDAA